MQVFLFFHNLAIPLFSQIVIFMIISNKTSVCNNTRDKQIGLLHGRPILLWLLWLQIELDLT